MTGETRDTEFSVGMSGSVALDDLNGFDAIPILVSKEAVSSHRVEHLTPGAVWDVGIDGNFGADCSNPWLKHLPTSFDKELMSDPLGWIEAIVQAISRALGFGVPIAALVMLFVALSAS